MTEEELIQLGEMYGWSGPIQKVVDEVRRLQENLDSWKVAARGQGAVCDVWHQMADELAVALMPWSGHQTVCDVVVYAGRAVDVACSCSLHHKRARAALAKHATMKGK